MYNGRCGVSTDDNGLYYMRQRYYNPEIKRFVNQDILTGSIGNSQSLNRYSYVQGNPVSYTDLFGLSPLNGLFSGTMLPHTVCELLGWIPGPVGSIANAVDGLVYLLVDKDYKNALYSLGSSVSFGAGKLVAWAGKGSKTALRIQRVCNFAGSAINFAQSAEGTVNMGGMMIDKYITQGQPFDDSTAMEFLFLGANIFGATKSGAAIATDVRDFGKFVKLAGIPSLKGDNRGVVNAKAFIDAFKSGSSSEVFYRTMSQADYDYLRMTGELPATSETFISPTYSFSSNYDGVTVEFELRNGTTNSLLEIGVGNNADQAIRDYGVLPQVSKGWTENNAFFKGEGTQTNIGLGKGKALEIFNSNIINFKQAGGK